MYQDIAYITAVTGVEYQIRDQLYKDKAYLILAGVLWGSFARILEKIDRIITAPHCMNNGNMLDARFAWGFTDMCVLFSKL